MKCGVQNSRPHHLLQVKKKAFERLPRYFATFTFLIIMCRKSRLLTELQSLVGKIYFRHLLVRPALGYFLTFIFFLLFFKFPISVTLFIPLL